ncbi:MAG: sulfatase-like hydrolase/transferase [Candidatus Hodarchaeota archaeon]
MDGKPNIIVIMTDEHDPSVTRCYGDEIVQTPNIDKLAAEGVTFDNCYTTSPLCVPARLSFTAGKYISRVSAWNNSWKLSSDDISSVPHLLNDVGYETVLCGKMHYDKNCRYGFKKDLVKMANNKKKVNVGLRRSPDDFTPNFKSWEGRIARFYPGDDSRVLKQDREVTAQAIEYFKSRKDGDPPFFMLAGYLSPHFPLIVPEVYYKKYKDKVPMPDIPEGLIENLPLNYKHLRAGFGMTNQPPEIVKKGRELYWAFVEWMDGEVGKILDALEEEGLKEDTVIIFTTDHGENKGDHGLWWKNNMYDHASRIPFIIRWPNRLKGDQRRDGVCSLMDMVQTIVEIAGTTSPDDWDGDSLVPYLDNASAPWKNYALSEYYGHNIASGITMLRKGDYKYVYHNKVKDREPDIELFNMKKDPKEFENLANKPEFKDLVSELHALMVKELGMEPDEIEKIYLKQVGKGKTSIIKFGVRLYSRITNRRLKKKKEITNGV